MIDNIVLPLTDESREEVEREKRHLTKANTKLMEDIAQHGMVDYQAQMLETYFEAMVEIGLIDADQLLVIRLSWEQRFNHQLRDTKRQINEMIEKQRAASRLVTPGGPKAGGLIVPGR